MNTAIIVAAGSGKRFASHQTKQFVKLLGRPVIIYTLEKFDTCPVVDEVVLVLSDEGRLEFEEISSNYEFSTPIRIVVGGENRAESVRNALNVIDAATADIVAVHDGARPLVSVDEIKTTIEKASEIGAACLVADVTDTIKEIDGEFISGTIDRNRLKRALTPQAFRYEVLWQAFNGNNLDDSVTDECFLVEKLGAKIAIVEGSSINIKITRPEDLVLAEAYLKSI